MSMKKTDMGRDITADPRSFPDLDVSSITKMCEQIKEREEMEMAGIFSGEIEKVVPFNTPQGGIKMVNLERDSLVDDIKKLLLKYEGWRMDCSGGVISIYDPRNSRRSSPEIEGRGIEDVTEEEPMESRNLYTHFSFRNKFGKTVEFSLSELGDTYEMDQDLEVVGEKFRDIFREKKGPYWVKINMSQAIGLS